MNEYATHKRVPTVRVDDSPLGDEVQIDFGKMGRLRDDATGKTRDLWPLVVMLTFSRFMFVMPTFSQTTATHDSDLRRVSVATCEPQSNLQRWVISEVR